MSDSSARQKLKELHSALMRLHKVLLDEERAAYEKANGSVGGAGRMLDLVMTDPWFDWLRAISRMIVRIDEVTDEEQVTPEAFRQVMSDVRILFSTTGAESDFMSHYRQALRRSSAAVNLHFELQKVLVPDA